MAGGMIPHKMGDRVFVPSMLAWTAVVHACALSTLIFYWNGWLFMAAFGLAMLTAYSMGIFHHMQLTHNSFESKRWVTRVGALLGTLTWRGAFAPPLKYAAVHKVHHEHADRDLDPHSPVHGIGHAFMGWFWWQSRGLLQPESYLALVEERWTKDSVLQFLDRHPHLLQAAYGLILWAIGGWALFLYGVFVKTVIVLWAANAVDVINHTLGYRNFETNDQSTNSFLMAVLHWGGAISWHNNHHAHPDFFSVRVRGWEFDIHRWVLRVLEQLGWVWNIRYLDLASPVPAPAPIVKPVTEELT